MFQSGSEAFFFSPLRCLLWGGEANTISGVRGLGWSRAGVQEDLMFLSSLDTAINMSLIPHVDPSTADNLLGEEFHLWWSPQGNLEVLLNSSRFFLGKRGLDYMRYQTRFFFGDMKQNWSWQITSEYFFCLQQGQAEGSWAASTRQVIYLVIGKFIF